MTSNSTTGEKEGQSLALLSVEELSIGFWRSGALLPGVRKVSFQMNRGVSLGIVGESGSGKSLTILAILDMHRGNPAIRSAGKVSLLLDNEVVVMSQLSPRDIQRIRGHRVGLVFQEPLSILNPTLRCGDQILEVLDIHNIGVRQDRKSRVLTYFKLVSLTEEERIYDAYPHELSGGQLQRVCIAMALICEPDLLICDEATSSLDTITQREIMNLLSRLVNELAVSLIFVSHDLNLVRKICEEIIIMKNGEIVEQGLTTDILTDPQEQYTQMLIDAGISMNPPSVAKHIKGTQHRSTRAIETTRSASYEYCILSVYRLSVYYTIRGKRLMSAAQYFHAADDVSFSIYKSEIVGIIGESGSGKSSIASVLAGLRTPSKGDVLYYANQDTAYPISGIPRREIQLIFQDPYSSLTPSMSVGDCIREVLRYHRLRSSSTIKDRVVELLEMVGLSQDHLVRMPHQLSGGQRQRVCIARALALEPEILICDECVSALDLITQRQIIELLHKIRNQLKLSILFISHDLGVVNELCDHMIVLRGGRIVEQGMPYEVLTAPQDPYTQRLVTSTFT